VAIPGKSSFIPLGLCDTIPNALGLTFVRTFHCFLDCYRRWGDSRFLWIVPHEEFQNRVPMLCIYDLNTTKATVDSIQHKGKIKILPLYDKA